MDEAQFLEELKKDFFEEARSMIESLEKNILIIENDHSNKEAVNEIFRSAHTLKGGSATLDFERIVALTHEMENLLDEIRSGNMELDSTIIDILLEATDVVKILVQASAEGLEAKYGVESYVIANIKKAYRDNKENKSNTYKEETKVPEQEEEGKEKKTIARSIELNDHEKYLIRMSSKAGYSVYKISISIIDGLPQDKAKQLYTKLKDLFIVLQSNPPITELEGSDKLELLIQTSIAEEEIEEEIHKRLSKAISENTLNAINIYKLSIQDIDDITEIVYETKGILLNEYDLQKIEREIISNKKVYKIISFFDADNPMRSVSGLLFYNMLGGFCNILKSSSSYEEFKEPNTFYPRSEFIVSTGLHTNELQKRLHLDNVTSKIHFQEFKLDLAEKEETPSEEELVSGEENEEISKEAKRELFEDSIFESELIDDSKDTIVSASKRKQLYSVLRVESSRIDQMLNFVGELVITKASFLQINEEMFSVFEHFINLFNTNKFTLRELYHNLEELFEHLEGGMDNLFPDNPMEDGSFSLPSGFIPKANGEEDDEDAFDYDLTAKNIKDKMDILTKHFEKAMLPFRITYDKLKSACQSIERITDDLQEGVMSIRMIPINQIFNRFPRLVRDISRTLNKEIVLVMEGEDTELDKSVIEDLLDPLIHIIRNAVDHGIELPEEREEKGKQAKGTILLRAEHEGNTIIITVRDDGRGLDADRIRKKAIESNIIDHRVKLSRQDIIDILFRPGFSTAPKVSSISGRGVGMDVVRQKIENLSGSVEIDTKEGEWTSFTLKIPLTLAIIQALLIKVSDYIYSIPINSVIETMQVSHKDIQSLENTEVIRIREDVLSLVRLANLFNHRHSPTGDEYFYVIIVGSRGKKVGLAVDSLIGEQDVVIKPLSNKYTNVPGIAGATILGDGQVSLVIDVVGLFSLISTQDRATIA